ncbi:MAG TPA: exosortase A [Vicinamibacterales bacterium]|nr:exosortase A [Vicinamibacterales bacterium]
MQTSLERAWVWIATALTAAAFVVLFRPILAGLVAQWAEDDSYSHGFLVVPIAAWFAWERRRRFRETPASPSLWGLAAALASLLLLAAGLAAAELFLTRIAIIVMIAASVLFLFGWARLRVMTFPIAFLLLMVPLPTIVFNQIAFPLQLVASRVGEVALAALQIPVLREGNVIVIPAARLEVVEACSGIRSLLSLLAVGIVYGYFTDPRPAVRAGLAAATIPIAILANGLRIAGTGVAAHLYGAAAADGFFHAFSGWLVFMVAFGLLVAVGAVLRWIAPVRAARGDGLAHPELETA